MRHHSFPVHIAAARTAALKAKKTPEPVEVAPEPVEVAPEPDYDSMTKKELLSLASERGLSLPPRALKAEVLAALTNAS